MPHILSCIRGRDGEGGRERREKGGGRGQREKEYKGLKRECKGEGAGEREEKEKKNPEILLKNLLPLLLKNVHVIFK